MHLNGQTFSGVLKQFFFNFKVFGVKKRQKSIFLKKMVLRVVVFFFFIKLTFRCLQTGLLDLKNTKQLKFCIW